MTLTTLMTLRTLRTLTTLRTLRALKPLLDLKPYTAELLLDFILKPVALGEEGAEL